MSETTPKRTRVQRLLIALVSTVCNHPRAVLALAVVLCGVSCVLGAFCLSYHTSRNDLISAHKDCQRRWLAYLKEFGDDDDIVVIVEGEDRASMRLALDQLAARLEGEPALFDRLFYKVDLRHLRNRALLLAPFEQIQAIHRDYLGDLQPLLHFGQFGWRALGLQRLLVEARQRLQGQVPGQPISGSDERFFRQLVAVGKAARQSIEDEHGYSSPWANLMGQQGEQEQMLAEPHYFFSADGKLAFLLVRPVKEAGSFTAALRSVAKAREILAQVGSDFPQLRLGLTGLPVLETDEMVAAETDTKLASYIALVGVSLLFLLVYRGIAYPLLTVATLLIGTAWAFGWLTLTVGHLNILSATFAVLLIGMGDYGVLWVMRYEQARGQGMDVRSALLHTTTHVAIGNLTAASTLALAFFAARFADFKAVAELGWIAGCGVLLCALACFTVLPALLMLFDRRGRLSGLTLPLASTDREALWLPWLHRHPGLVLASGLAVALVVCSGIAKVRYDHNLLHLQAQDLDSVRWQRKLVQHTTGASWHAVSYTRNRDEARALAERYRQLPEVSQVIEVASLVPTDQQRKLPLVADIHRLLGWLPRRESRLPHDPPDVVALRRQLVDLVDRLEPLGDSQRLLADVRNSLVGLQAVLRDTPNDLATKRLQRFDERLAEDLCENLHRLRDVASPEPIRIDDLPSALRQRYIGQNETWLLRIFARDDLWDFEPLEQFTERIRSIDPEATGKPFTTVEGLKAMKSGLQRAGLYAFGVIVFVLWLDFRSLGRTVLAVLPLLLGVALSVGVLGIIDWPLNPANMIAFPLILGVGVDNGVHILHDWLIRRRRGLVGVSRAIGWGVLVKALTTMVSFGTLMVSTERGLVGLGFILTLGVGCSMLSALLLLPAVLQLLTKQLAAPVNVRTEVPQPLRRAA
jgi:hopanoid biosynthesis associated RND transporter like protein HpnN